MSTTNGQVANQTTFNNAYMSRTSDTSTIGKINLNNTADPNSGAQVLNAQRFLNHLADSMGVLGEADATAKIYANNFVIIDGENHKQSIERLDAEFDPATGHSHDGVDSPLIDAADLDGLNYYRSAWQEFSKSSASGLSVDVSTELTGKSPGGAVATAGVVTSAPYNQCELRSLDTGTYIEDSEGQRVYGRITESAGVWTLEFFTNEGGTETAHTLASQNIQVIYREVFTLDTLPTFQSDSGVLGSFDLTADVVDATSSVSGKVLLANTAPDPISATGAAGSGPRVALEDHTHEGVHSLDWFGGGTPLLGDVVLEAGTNVTLSYSSGRIKIDATGGGTTWSDPVDSNITVDTNNVYDLGAVNNGFKHIYANRYLSIDGTMQMDFTFGVMVFDSNAGDINFNSNATGVVNFGADRLKVFSATGASPGTLELRKIGGANWIAFRPDNGISTNTEYVWPTDGTSGQVLSTNGAGALSWVTPSSGANTSLSNLTSTSINQDLIPDNGTHELGQAGSNFWLGLYVQNIYDVDGTLSYETGVRQIWNSGVAIFDAATNATVKVLGDNTDSGRIQLNKANNAFSTTLKCNDSISADITFILPQTVGSNLQYLRGDGSGGLSFEELVARPDTTANRPGSPTAGQQYFDTTLGIPIWYDGTNWIDATGTTV